MQRQRNIFDIFPDTVDLNQRPNSNSSSSSNSNSNSRGMNESGECNNRLCPSERRILSNDRLNELNKSQSFSSWDVGESSSGANVQDQVFGLKLGSNWSSSFETHDSRFRERQFDHQIPVGALNMPNSGSNHVPMDVDLNLEYKGNSSNDGGPLNSGFGSTNHYSSSNTDMEASSSGTSDERGTIWGSSVPPGVHGRSQRYYGMRDSGSSNIFSTGNRGSSSNSSSSHEPSSSRRPSHSQYLDQALTNSSHRSHQQPPSTQAAGMPRNLLPFPLSSNVNSRNGSLSNEMRSLVQEPFNLNLGTGRSNINGGGNPSSSRNDNIWLPNLNSSTLDEQRPTDIPPWTLFPNLDAESGGHRGPYRNFAPGPSSNSEEHVLPGRHRQPYLRSFEVPDDDELQVDIERRNWLASEMRQLLNVLRRNEGLRVEDHMPFDPFINGVADLHDRHRDMRLDVDNMSYEELLALEERIGDVKIGLSEEVIMRSMKQRKHMFFIAISTQHLEPCCICQEEYENGDDIGTLDCGHDFHTCCIKQWLTQKNICPICKKTGLTT